MAFSPDGKLALTAAVGDMSGVINLWDAATGRRVVERSFSLHDHHHDGRVSAVASSPDGKVLAVGTRHFGAYGNVQLVDIATGEVFQEFPDDGSWGHVNGVAFSPDGKSVLVSAAPASGR